MRESSASPPPAAAEPTAIKVAIVGGGGFLGRRMAAELASLGNLVTVIDLNELALAEATASIRGDLLANARQGTLAIGDVETTMDRITFTSNTESGVSDSDIVFEAVPEDVQIKSRVIRSVSAACPETCIVASSTLSINIDLLAPACTKPERFLGIRFLWPIFLIDQVEMTLSLQTLIPYVRRAKSILRLWNKRPFYKTHDDVVGVRLTEEEGQRQQQSRLMALYTAQERTMGEEDGEGPGENTCLICLASQRDIQFAPCGHVTCCEPCARTLIATEPQGAKCLVCRTPVTSLVPVILM